MNLLLEMIQKRKKEVAAALGISVAAFLISLIWNNQLASLINLVGTGGKVEQKQFIWIFVIMVFMAISMFAETLITGWACENINHDFRMWYIKRYLTKDYTIIENMNAGGQQSKLQNEVSEISNYISTQFFTIITSVIKFLGTIIWLMVLDARLTIITNLPVVVIVVYVAFTSKVLKGYAMVCQTENENMNQMAETIMTLFPVIRIYDASKMMYKQYISTIGRWVKTAAKEERMRAFLMSLSALLTAIPLILLLFAGGKEVIEGKIPIGILYIFINLSGNVSGVMMNMPGNIGVFRRFTANLERVQENK